MYCHSQPLLHLLSAHCTRKIQCNKLILKPIINQILCRNTALQEPFHLLYHTLLQACLKPGIYTPVALIPLHLSAHIEHPLRQINLLLQSYLLHRALRRALQHCHLYLYGANSPLLVVKIGIVVGFEPPLCLKFHQKRRKLLHAPLLQILPKSSIGRHILKIVPAGGSLQIEPGPAADQRHNTPLPKRGINPCKIPLILENIIL